MITTVLAVISVLSLIACIVLFVWSTQTSGALVPSAGANAGDGIADPRDTYQTPAIITGIVSAAAALGAVYTAVG